VRAMASATAPATASARWSSVGTAVLGAVLGGLVGGFFVVGVTLVLKAGMDFAAGQDLWFVVVVPLLGLVAATLVLQGLGKSGDPARAQGWRTFPAGTIRADISADVVDSAGREEQLPWRLAPIRTLAILATVGSGGAMGTEAPAAYLGVAAGACLGDRGRWWRRLLRPAALAGGAAGVAALMAIPFVGTAFMLELGRRRHAPLSAERVAAALIGGVVGWAINVAFNLNLIRLVVPKEPPINLAQAAVTALFIGAAAGAISAFAGKAVYLAKQWQARPAVRLALGGGATVVIALLVAAIATPSAAVGPGGGAILWAENVNALPLTLLAVCLLRAAATTAAVAAGGCGGVFVPFLAVGDIAGRVFAPGLGVGNDLAGAAGAAAGIAGGYHLPITAIAMVLGVGGPLPATLTCLATVLVAFVAGAAAESGFDRLAGRLRAAHDARGGGR
jgi:chloride channel protein, CIC family